MATLYSLLLTHSAFINDLFFLSMALSSVYYFIVTFVFEITCLVQSFNERHRKSTLVKGEQSDLDVMITKYGFLFTSIIVYFLI